MNLSSLETICTVQNEFVLFRRNLYCSETFVKYTLRKNYFRNTLQLDANLPNFEDICYFITFSNTLFYTFGYLFSLLYNKPLEIFNRGEQPTLE